MKIIKVKNKKSKKWHEVDALTSTGYYSTYTEPYFVVELNMEEFNYVVNMPKKKYKGD